MTATQRQSVDLAGFPELVVVYLGMQVTGWRGIGTLARVGRGITQAVAATPDGLLRHEFMLFGPLHVGMRQYWRNLESLEAFTRAQPHKTWWADFLRDPAGTGFWHEAYRMQGGMEAIYLNLPGKIGFGAFAPELNPVGPFMSGRERFG